jgi:pyruvate/2-oxoglutarate dehydrogenase complex dihydrolipoamide acyltransferase (E2) component
LGAPVADFASSQARDLAAELGLAEVAIVGSGEAGRITVADVRAAAPAAPPPPPAGLGESGEQLWRAVVEEWELRTDQDQLLLAACRTADEIAAMEAVLETAEPVVKGSQGQVRPHPLFAEVRGHRLALQRLLGGIGIRDAAEGEDQDAERSHAGRQLARQRWNRG